MNNTLNLYYLTLFQPISYFTPKKEVVLLHLINKLDYIECKIIDQV